MKNAQWKKIALKKVRINLFIKKELLPLKKNSNLNETISASLHVSYRKYSIYRENIRNWIKHMKIQNSK